MQPFVLILGALLLAALWLQSLLRRRAQTVMLRRLAMNRRLNFSSDDLIGAYDRYHHLRLLSRGHGRSLCNVVYGSMDVGLIASFRYAFELGAGSHRRTEELWVVIVETPVIRDLSVLRLRAETPSQLLWVPVTASSRDTGLLKEARLDADWELQGSLIAAAVPFVQDADTLDRLIDDVCRITREIGESRPQPGDREIQPPSVDDGGSVTLNRF